MPDMRYRRNRLILGWLVALSLLLAVQTCGGGTPRPTPTPTPRSSCALKTAQDFWRAVVRRDQNTALNYIHPSLRSHVDPWCEVCDISPSIPLMCEALFHIKDIKLNVQSVSVVDQFEDEAYLEAAVRAQIQGVVREFRIRHHVVVEDGRCYLARP